MEPELIKPLEVKIISITSMGKNVIGLGDDESVYIYDAEYELWRLLVT